MKYDLVIHLDSDEEKMLRMCLRNATNYLNALQDENFSLCIVANGAGPKQLVKDSPELRNWAAQLASQGLKILVCANAIAEHGLNSKELWPMCEIVPAGLVEIVELQKRGFAYVKP